MPAPIFVPTLTMSEQKRLRGIIASSTDGKETRKALSIQMSSNGRKMGEIASELGINISTVRRWLLAFIEKGFASIPRATIPGRPKIADDEFEAAAAKALENSPKEYGYDATVWTAELLRGHLSLATHVLVSQRTMYQVLHRLNYVFKRPKLDLKHKQDAKEVSRAKRAKTLAKNAS